MSDYYISCNKKYLSFLQLLLKKLKESINNADIPVKRICGRYYACVDEKAINDEIMRDLLKELILVNYKYVFFKKCLNIKIKDKALESLFFTSITLYDTEYDCELVQFKPLIKNELTLDGVFNFCIDDLKQRWFTVAEILQENFYGDSDRDAMYEFIKHIIYTLPSKIKEVNIYKRENFYEFLDSEGKSIAQFISANGEELASKIMYVNPAFINFYNCSDRQTMVFLKNIFNERIRFYR